MSSRKAPEQRLARGSQGGRVRAGGVPAIPPNFGGRIGVKNFEIEAERKFQSRNELDAMVQEQERNNERRRNAEFQERRRQTGLTSKQIAEARAIGRARSEEIRVVNRAKFDIKKVVDSGIVGRELNKEAVAGRKIGRESVSLANALFGGKGLEQVATSEAIRHTAVKPRTIREPEPEPEPEPEVEVRGGVKGRPQPLVKTEARGIGTQEGGGFNLAQPSTPFIDPRLSRKIGE